jgi:hypothetical protein
VQAFALFGIVSKAVDMKAAIAAVAAVVAVGCAVVAPNMVEIWALSARVRC